MSNNLITPLTYNNLQATVARVLGVGTGNSGYGQLVASSQIVTPPETEISVQQWTNLRNDLVKCYAHQTNVAATNTSAIVSKTPPALQLITNTALISNDIAQQYANFVSNINANRL
jgi:hypothetical protein